MSGNYAPLMTMWLFVFILLYAGNDESERFTTVTATVYNAVESQTDDTPLITASGAKIDPADPQRWIAVSRNLEKKGYVFGTKVCVENAGYLSGEWEVQDRMNWRYINRIDFLVHESITLGKWEDVKISIIDESK